MTVPRTIIYDAHGKQAIYVSGHDQPLLGAVVRVSQRVNISSLWPKQARALAAALIRAADWVDEQ